MVNAAGPTDTHAHIARSARATEDAGLDSLWAGDHLMIGNVPLLDSTLVMAAAAAATERIELGLAVFVPSLRALAWAAKQVATLSLLCGGRRLQLGIGAGGGPEEEYQAAGFDMSERGHRTDLFLEKLPDLMAGHRVRVTEARTRVSVQMQPPVPMPTVWIGGTSLAALRRTARFGDGWLAGLLTPAEFERAAVRLHELADEAGRPRPRLGLVTHAAVATSNRSALRESAVAVLRSTYGLPADRAEELAIAGPPARVAEQLQAYVATGAEHIAVISDSSQWATSCDNLALVRERLLES
jgi:alkanesulfonate monooxygenase SsuD/methylene tetrahydromethanopterin reductase-like flavin-dependent oxidoreductase (luciferase family)